MAVVLNPLRVGEHCKLHWDNIEDDLTATVVLKGGRKHEQPLTPAYIACATSQRDNGGYLFPGRYGGHYHRTSLSDLANDGIKSRGVEGAVAHDLRKSFKLVA
jgi:integrase